MISAPKQSRIFGVRTRLHYSWLAAFVLAIAMVVTQFPEAYPLWQRIILGMVAGLLFFLAICIREFILSFMTIRKGIPLRRVYLFVFGGVPQIAKEATLPSLELLLAVVGLLSNLAIAGVFYGVHLILVKAGNVMVAGLTQWLAFMYSMLALFHFVPGFPLDGGRILRALLWKVIHNYDRATRIASWIGWVIGLLCIVGGILVLIVTRQWFTGLVLVLAGWALERAAAQSRRQAALHEALQGITAGDIMSRECPIITHQLNLDQLVRDYILITAQRYFVVADGTKLQGVLTMRDIKPVPKHRWSSTPVGEIMTPASQLKIAHSQQSAASLLEQMDDFEIDHIPVLEKDSVVGVVTRDSLIRLGKTRAQLRI